MKKINIEYLNPFGAGILCGTLPDDLLKNFQDLSKEVLKEKTTAWNYQLVGRIQDEWKIPHLLYRDYNLENFLDGAFHKYVESYYHNFKRILNLAVRHPQEKVDSHDFNIVIDRGDGWVNSMEEGEYNPTHQHTNCDLSSIFYLDEYQGDKPRDFKRKDVNMDGNSDLGGVTEFLLGSTMNGVIPKRTPIGMTAGTGFPQMTHFNVKPKKGDFMIFPNWLLHSVYPFIGKGRRITISVNASYKVDVSDDMILNYAVKQDMGNLKK